MKLIIAVAAAIMAITQLVQAAPTPSCVIDGPCVDERVYLHRPENTPSDLAAEKHQQNEFLQAMALSQKKANLNNPEDHFFKTQKNNPAFVKWAQAHAPWMLAMG